MDLYALSVKGSEKSHNEDRIVIDDLIIYDKFIVIENAQPRVAGIADGVGGNAGGELASEFVCKNALSLHDENILMKSAELNRRLLEYAETFKEKEKMATTFSAVIFDGPDKIIHMGNTRIYAVQGNYLKQLTNDHTTYNALLSRGLFRQAELCNKNEILTCFGGGTSRFFEPDIYALSEFSQFIVTSDGIHDFIDTDSIEEIIRTENDTETICSKIVECALQNGSYDDMSILIIKK